MSESVAYFCTFDPNWTRQGATVFPTDPAVWLIFTCSGILFDCPTIQSPGNPTWNMGTGPVTIAGTLLLGAAPATVGTVRFSAGQDWEERNNANTADVNIYAKDAANNQYFGDRSGLSPALYWDNAYSQIWRIGAERMHLTPTYLELGVPAFYWQKGVTDPAIYHETDTTVGGVRPAFSMHAQDSTVAGSTGADMIQRPGHGVATRGQWIVQDPDGVTWRFWITASGDIAINADAAIMFQIGFPLGGTRMAVLSTYVGLFGVCRTLQWMAAVAGPELIQESADLGNGVAPQVLTLGAQSNTNGATPLTGHIELATPEADPSYTVAQLNAAPMALCKAKAGTRAFCTDETGGAVPVFSDGANWRRCTDRVVIS